MKIKKAVALLLTLALFAGLLPAVCAPVAAAETMEERQQALVAVALAYYDKGRSVQYDGTTIVDKILRSEGGKTRSTNQEPPEFATPHETFYSVCSDFMHQVYWETFHYQFMGRAGSCWTGGIVKLPETNPEVIYHFEKSSGKDPKEALRELYVLAQPGDVFTTYSTAGHAMLFIGDALGDGGSYWIHSFGSGINADTGRDAREYKDKNGPDVDPRYGANSWADGSGGGIRLTPNAENYLVSAYGKGNQERFSLTRPLNIMSPEEYPITSATKFRMLRPRLSIDRIIEEKTRFTSATPGEELTLSVTLKNNSGSGYAFPVKETIPAGVELVRDPISEEEDAPTVPRILGGGSERNGVVSWNVRLEAGESKTIGYVCRVTAERGAQIVFDGGSVGSSGSGIIPSNRIPITVGGRKLTAEDNALLASIADGAYAEILDAAPSETLGQTIYARILGRSVTLPTIRQVLSGAAETRSFQGSSTTYKCYVFKDESEITPENLWIYRTLVPMFHSGMRVWNEWGHERCIDPRDMHVEAGDIIVTTPNVLAANPTQDMMVYLGNGKYVRKTDGATEIVEEPEFVKCILKSGYYVLRPTLAYNELPGVATASVVSGTAAPGKTGTATVELTGNPGMREAELTLTYPEGLTLTAVEPGTALGSLTFMQPASLSSPVTLRWSGSAPDSANGTLATLRFTAAADAAEGEYPLTCASDGMLTEDGVIRVLSFLPGDISGDGQVNAKDVTVLRRSLAGGYGVSVDSSVGDVNHDGSVNAKDVTVLRRYLAGGYGVDLAS